jgi:AbrB family looped-hinge helix DNA binding protein
MKVGPKGQVVIPQEYRVEMNLMPGSHIYFERERNRLYLKSAEDPIKVFERIAKSGKSVDLDPHEAYEGSMRSRMHAWSGIK